MSFCEEWQCGISLFPKFEEILISLPRRGVVTAQCRRARILPLRQRIKRRERIPAAMIQNALEFGRSLCAISLFQVSLPAHELRPIIPVHFIAARSFEQLRCLGRVTASNFRSE